MLDAKGKNAGEQHSAFSTQQSALRQTRTFQTLCRFPAARRDFCVWEKTVDVIDIGVSKYAPWDPAQKLVWDC
jgi:hypothetical protein